MDRTLILLLLALALTWLAWRAARRQGVAARAAREEALEGATSTLEPVEAADGRGFVVVLSSGQRSDRLDMSWEQHGVQIARVVDFQAAGEAATSPAFAPGSAVELIPDDDDDRTIRVWDRSMTVRAGRLPDDDAELVRDRADAGEIGTCLVLWERRAHGRRSGIDVLILHADMLLET
jgi:hypothetical protein